MSLKQEKYFCRKYDYCKIRMFHRGSINQRRMTGRLLKNKLLCSNRMKSVNADPQNRFILRFIRIIAFRILKFKNQK